MTMNRRPVDLPLGLVPERDAFPDTLRDGAAPGATARRTKRGALLRRPPPSLNCC